MEIDINYALVGKKFNYLTVLGHYGLDKHKRNIWLCLCDCGNTKLTTSGRLQSGNSKTCGKCSINKKHGYHGTKVYSIWRAMVSRCKFPSVEKYKYYGGKGVRVCGKWDTCFLNFLEDMGEPPTNKHSIDRIDSNKDYYKENCRWATQQEQVLNKSSTVKIEFNGERKSIKGWTKELKVSRLTLNKLLSRGVPFDKIYSDYKNKK